MKRNGQKNDAGYVHTVLKMYVGLPETPTRPRPQDRALAHELFKRGIEVPIVEAALLLASVRRLARDSTAPSLSPVRSLHYFLPVIEEIQMTALATDYLGYLRKKLAGLVKMKRLGQFAPKSHHVGACLKNRVSC
jgi:hypothetical protein